MLLNLNASFSKLLPRAALFQTMFRPAIYFTLGTALLLTPRVRLMTVEDEVFLAIEKSFEPLAETDKNDHNFHSLQGKVQHVILAMLSSPCT